MTIRYIKILFVCACLGTLSPAYAGVNGSNTTGLSSQGQAAGILIKMRNDSTPLSIARAGGQPRLSTQTMANLNVAAATALTYQRTISLGAHVLKFDHPLPLAEADAVAARLMSMADVAYATPNLIIKPMLDATDPLYTSGTQWSLNDPTAGANLPVAWDTTTGSDAINIAVIDTGYTEHSDLQYTQFASDGYDFITDATAAGDSDGRDSDARDEGDFCVSDNTVSSWHGTGIMSIIGAITNNALMAGINWHAKMIPVRVLGRCGGDLSDLIDAIRWSAGLSVAGVPANPHPAKVINMSLGSIGECNALLQSAIDDAHTAGAVLVAAAGNFSLSASSTTPANCAHVMAIAAHDQAGDIGVFSNYGDKIDLSAPGVYTVIASCASTTTYNCKDSTDWNNKERGTSLSAPMVSGVASLMLSVKPSLNNYYVESILRNSARPFVTGSTCIGRCGSGMLDAGAALALESSFVPPATQVAISRDGGGGGAALPGFWLGLLILAWLARVVNRERVARTAGRLPSRGCRPAHRTGGRSGPPGNRGE